MSCESCGFIRDYDSINKCRLCVRREEKAKPKRNSWKRIHPEIRDMYASTRWVKRLGLPFSKEASLKFFEGRQGPCAICGKKTDQKLHLDHDHKTNRFRGFLCFNCNAGLGHFKDSCSLLHRAVKYLKNSQPVALKWARK